MFEYERRRGYNKPVRFPGEFTTVEGASPDWEVAFLRYTANVLRQDSPGFIQCARFR
jgi:hypothetical protein